MKIIEDELEIVKIKLKETFIELFNGELSDFMFKGSKMIRSTLPILFLKLYGQDIKDKTYEIIACTEFIHNASLLHDDVIDQAQSRRGKTTIKNLFSSKMSILSGDYLVSFAVEKLIKIENFVILELFNNCIKIMCEAEIKQAFLCGKNVTLEDYLSVCEGKTAKLFETSMKSVAIIQGLDVNIFAKFGRIFGILFQINNDMQEDSVTEDKSNSVMTVRDILGIEKTKILSDNYKKELLNILDEFPNSVYKKGLEGLVNSL